MLTTHLRARAAQAGALLAVVAGGIAIAPGVALADPPNVQITNLPTDVVSGGTLTMQYTVAPANDNGGGNAVARVEVKSDFKCSGQCGQISQVDNGGSTFTARLTAPTVNAGDSRNVNVTITATINGESASTNQTVTVKGPDKPKSVRQISGKVKDQDGKPIPGASVAIRDSAGNPYSTTTNGSGGYSFTSSDSKPIVPGNISVGALKDGYQTVTVQIQAEAGRSVNVPLTLKLLEAATPSVSASASAEASAPVDETTDQPSAEAAPVDPATKSASDNSGGGGSLLFILLGGLLVAAGVGAIVLVVMRRKNAADDGLGPDDPTAMGGGGGVVPPSQGRFNDATRVAAPMGAGRDATMVAPRTAGGASMSDAPTMLQRPVPVEDEFPDPYGAPIPQQGGPYGGAAAGGWDDQRDGYGAGSSYAGGGSGYSEPTQYGRPQDDDGYAGYGSARGGNGYGGGAAQQRYDEPTGMYRPEAEQDDGYGYDRGGYGGGQAPYGGAAGGGGYQAGSYSGGGYDQGGYDRGGYEPDAGGNGYSAQQSGGAYSGGAYGGSQYGGYEEGRDGYGGEPAGGYDQRGGAYGRPAGGYDQGGYDEPGYGDQGGYGRQQPPPGGYGGQSRQQEPSHPGQRRSLDWMDN